MASRGRKNTIGNILQKVGRALSGGSSRGRRSGRTTTRTSRRRTKSSGKGLLRRLLG